MGRYVSPTAKRQTLVPHLLGTYRHRGRLRRQARSADRHGPLGKLYPLNTTHKQKEGDTMTFLYLVPTGMNDPEQPGGEVGPDAMVGQPDAGDRATTGPISKTAGTTRPAARTRCDWAAAIQNDFAARADWCVTDKFAKANDPPAAVLNGDGSQAMLHLSAKPGDGVKLSASGSSDPDGERAAHLVVCLSRSGHLRGRVPARCSGRERKKFPRPGRGSAQTIHVVLALRDEGCPTSLVIAGPS